MQAKRSIYVLVALMSIALTALMVVQYVWLSSAVKIKAEEFDRNVLSAMRETAIALEEKNSLRFLANEMNSDSTMKERTGIYRFIEDAADEEVVDSNGEKQSVVTINNAPGQKKIVIRTHTKNGEVKEERTEVCYAIPPPPLPPDPPAAIGPQPLPIADERKKFINVMCKAADEYTAAKNDWKETLDSALLSKTIARQFQKMHLPGDYSFAVVNSDNDSVLLNNQQSTKPDKFKFKTELMGFNFSGKGLLLMVDFPSRLKFVLASLISMFVLSLVFSAVIIAVFVLALQLIFRQRKLNEITNDFINNMTHEFKTPLATITMTADTLNMESVNGNREQVKEYAAMIKEETGKLSSHVDRILEAASLEKESPRASAVNLRQVIQKQIEQHENAFVQNMVELNAELPSETVKVIADEEQLAYVISNLLDNAVKYSEDKPEISIKTETASGNVLLKIRDNGIGIAKENQRLIFEKFFRVHTGNRHDVKGFGLGLSFVKNVVELWGGKVWVESEPEKGSTFFVQLKQAGR